MKTTTQKLKLISIISNLKILISNIPAGMLPANSYAVLGGLQAGKS